MTIKMTSSNEADDNGRIELKKLERQRSSRRRRRATMSDTDDAAVVIPTTSQDDGDDKDDGLAFLALTSSTTSSSSSKRSSSSRHSSRNASSKKRTSSTSSRSSRRQTSSRSLSMPRNSNKPGVLSVGNKVGALNDPVVNEVHEEKAFWEQISSSGAASVGSPKKKGPAADVSRSNSKTRRVPGSRRRATVDSGGGMVSSMNSDASQPNGETIEDKIRRKKKLQQRKGSRRLTVSAGEDSIKDMIRQELMEKSSQRMSMKSLGAASVSSTDEVQEVSKKDRIRRELMEKSSQRMSMKSLGSTDEVEASKKDRIRQELMEKQSLRMSMKSIGTSSVSSAESSIKKNKKDKIRKELKQKKIKAKENKSLGENASSVVSIISTLDEQEGELQATAAKVDREDGEIKKLDRRQMLEEKLKSKSTKNPSEPSIIDKGVIKEVDRRQLLEQKLKSKSMRHLSETSFASSVDEEWEPTKLDRRQMLNEKVRSKSMRSLSASMSSLHEEKGGSLKIDRRQQKLNRKSRSSSVRGSHSRSVTSLLDGDGGVEEGASSIGIMNYEPIRNNAKKSKSRSKSSTSRRLSKSVSSIDETQEDDIEEKKASRKSSRRLSKSVSSLDYDGEQDGILDKKSSRRRSSRHTNPNNDRRRSSSMSLQRTTTDGADKDDKRESRRRKQRDLSKKNRRSASVSDLDRGNQNNGEATVAQKEKNEVITQESEKSAKWDKSVTETKQDKAKCGSSTWECRNCTCINEYDAGPQQDDPSSFTCKVCEVPQNEEGVRKADDQIQPTAPMEQAPMEQSPIESSDERRPSVVHVTECMSSKIDDSVNSKVDDSVKSKAGNKLERTKSSNKVSAAKSESAKSGTQWECSNCTFVNDTSDGGNKKKDDEQQQPLICQMCSEPKHDPGSWTCKKCTYFNEPQDSDEVLLFCKVCDEPNEQCAAHELNLLEQLDDEDGSEYGHRPEHDGSAIEEEKNSKESGLFTGLAKRISRRKKKKKNAIKWECQRCSYKDNEEHAKFCGSCGKSLIKVPKKSRVK